jgi:hypothetical protein
MNLVKLQDDLKMLPMAALQSKAQGQDPQVPPWLATAVLNERMDAQKKAGLAQGAKGDQPSIAEQLNQKAGLMALQGQQQQQAQQQMISQMAQAPQPAPVNVPQPEQQPQPQMMAQGGLARLNVNPRMFDYRAGGIIGFNGVESSDIPKTQALDAQRVEAAARAKKIKELQDKVNFLRKAEAPQAAQAEAELAALLQPPSRPAAGIPTALPKPAPPTPPPVAPRPAPRPAPAVNQAAPPPQMTQAAPPATSPGLPSVAPQSELEKMQMEVLRAKAPDPTVADAQADYKAATPEALRQPAGLEQLARLKQQQGQYDESQKDRSFERLMKVLGAGGSGGMGGFGSGYLGAVEGERASDAAQSAYQDKVMTAIEATRRGEATAEQKAVLEKLDSARNRKSDSDRTRSSNITTAAGNEAQRETAGLNRASQEKIAELDRKLRIQLNNTPPAQRATVEEKAILDFMVQLKIPYSQAYEKVKLIGASTKGTMTLDQATDNVGNFLESTSGMQYVSRLQKEAKDAGKPVPDIYAIRKELIKKELGSQASTEPTITPAQAAALAKYSGAK